VNFRHSDRVSTLHTRRRAAVYLSFQEDGLKLNSHNVLARVCSAIIRLQRTDFRAASMSSCLAALGLCCTSAVAHDVRIEHVTIVSPELARPMRDATVYIHDDRIVSISRATSIATRRPETNAEVIDGHDLYLAPGLIDSHVHVGDLPGMTPEQEQGHPDIASATREQIPRSYLYFGFTTLIDLISTPALIAQWNAHEVHPDIYFCGGAPIVDGYPMNWAPKPQRYEQYPYLIVQRGEESTAPQGIDAAAHTPEAVVSRMHGDGALCVKSFFERGFGEE
jgi:hypothetical protein